MAKKRQVQRLSLRLWRLRYSTLWQTRSGRRRYYQQGKEAPVGTGFDAYKEEYVDMIEAGILDPTKVTRSALQNANSVASTY